MFRILRLGLLVLVMMLTFFTISNAGIERVAKRLTVFEVYGGYSSPVGKYDGFTFADFLIVNPFTGEISQAELDGSDVYNPSFHIGFSYGQVWNRHWMGTVGFRYGRHDVQDTIYYAPQAEPLTIGDNNPSLNQYDFEVNLNYMLTDISSRSVAPFFGLGLRSGITSTSFNGYVVDPESSEVLEYATENDFTVSMSLNFGADFKVWKGADERTFLAVSLVNSYDLLSNDNKPRYLNLGGAVRYYFRP